MTRPLLTIKENIHMHMSPLMWGIPSRISPNEETQHLWKNPTPKGGSTLVTYSFVEKFHRLLRQLDSTLRSTICDEQTPQLDCSGFMERFSSILVWSQDLNPQVSHIHDHGQKVRTLLKQLMQNTAKRYERVKSKGFLFHPNGRDD